MPKIKFIENGISVTQGIVRELTNRLQSAVPFPPEVVQANFVHDGALRGAVALVVEALEDDRHKVGRQSF